MGSPTISTKDVLLKLIESSLAKGHKKVAAQRTLMLLYRYEDAPDAYFRVMAEVLDLCKPAEAARMRRAGISWARTFRD